MTKINFKQSKYILPLIVLPFIFVFFYVFKSWGSGSKKSIVATQTDSIKNVTNAEEINTAIPGVSKDVEKGNIKDRFQSLREAYRHDKDFSAVAALEEGKKDSSGYSSSYSKEDIDNMISNEDDLDKLTGSLNASKAKLDRNMNRMIKNASQEEAYPSGIPRGIKPGSTPEEIYNELQREANVNNNINDNNIKPKDEMTVFREQMSLVDSMQKANTNAGTNNPTRTANDKKFNPSEDTTFKPLKVSTVPKSTSGFNTIRAFKASESIRAMIDHDEKVSAGTRVRIRLLQEIAVGNNIVSEGTYVYGFITGFQTQRINISISQIMLEGQPLPVKLDVFDNDGYLGIYVPKSNFLEFSKEIGTQGTSGLSSVETSNGNETMASSLVSKLFTTTGNSVNKLIRKDKAFVKYNYIIYLKEKTSN